MQGATGRGVTANKCRATSRGIFELKYFFTSSIASAVGGEAHSAEAVRHRIKQMIDAEPTGDVLSDDTIVEKLRGARSEEHTSELQSHLNLVCRLLLGKKKS